MRIDGMPRDWDSKLANKYDPEIRYGLFGLGGGGSGSTGGQANDGGAGDGGMNDANEGGDGGYSDTPADNGRDGAVENEGGGTSGGGDSGGGGGGHDPLGDIMAGLEAAEARAAAVLEAAKKEALGFIERGEKEAAKAVLENATKATQSILDQAGIADDKVMAFWRVAMNDLRPIINQGRFASDEIASMLGVRNSRGDLVTFDQEKLANTPGYKWAFDQGLKAVDNSAVGNALSGQHIKATMEYGAGVASQTFNTRLEQLGFLAQGGWDAAGKKADLAGQMGGIMANTHNRAGDALANTYNTAGGNLANIYTWSGGAGADTAMRAAESRVGLITGLATAGANLAMAQMNNDATMNAAASSADASKSNSMYGTIGTIGGALLGGPVGAGIGKFLGGLFS